MVFVISDFHGNLRGFNVLLKNLSKNDRVIMLGDACDRGPGGIEIMTKVMRDPRLTYIVGKHDDFILRTFSPLLVCNKARDSEWGKSCWLYNYNSSYAEWAYLQRYAPLLFGELLGWLSDCKVFDTYASESGKVFHIAHAKFPKDAGVSSASWKELERKNPKLLQETIWDRYGKDGDIGDYYTDGAITIIGHTPTDDNVVLSNRLYNVDSKLEYEAAKSDFVAFCLNDEKLYSFSQSGIKEVTVAPPEAGFFGDFLRKPKKKKVDEPYYNNVYNVKDLHGCLTLKKGNNIILHLEEMCYSIFGVAHFFFVYKMIKKFSAFYCTKFLSKSQKC